MNKAVVLLLSMFVGGAANAQLCTVVTADVANRAAALLTKSSTAFTYCHSCTDYNNRALQWSVRKVELKAFQNRRVVRPGFEIDQRMAREATASGYQVLLNDKVMNLNFLFDGQGKNIGQLAGCTNDSPSELSQDIMSKAIRVVPPRSQTSAAETSATAGTR